MSLQAQDIRTGHCLCGKVTLSARVTERGLSCCHCEECQRWTGGGPLISIPAQDVQIDGEAHVTVFASSEWGERAFCSICGSNMWWRMKGHALAFLPAGVFQDKTGWEITEEIFVDRRPDWIAPVPGATQKTEAEMFAQLHSFLEDRAP